MTENMVGVNAYWIAKVMRGSKKFCQRGSSFDNVFFVLFVLFNKGRDDSNANISGPSSSRQRNAIYDGPTLNFG